MQRGDKCVLDSLPGVNTELLTVCEGDGQREEDETAAVRHRNLSSSCGWLCRPDGYATAHAHTSLTTSELFYSLYFLCVCVYRKQWATEVLH